MNKKQLSRVCVAMVLTIVLIGLVMLLSFYGIKDESNTSLSLFPYEGTDRPVTADFKMMGDRLVTYTGTATTIHANDFPIGIKTIGINAFSTSKVKYIEFPNTVTVLENNCFYGCSDLINVSIPSSCTTIGYGAFHRCDNLSKIVVNFDNPTVFSTGVFSTGKQNFEMIVPKDSYYDFYNFSRLSNVKNNIVVWNNDLTIEDFNNGKPYNTKIAFGETVTLPIPTKMGYHLVGWKDTNGNSVENTFRWMSLDNLQLKPVWEIERYEIVYFANDGQTYYLSNYGLSLEPCQITYNDIFKKGILQELYTKFRKPGEYLSMATINNIKIEDGGRVTDLGENNARYLLDLKFEKKHYNLRFDTTLSNLNIASIDNIEYGQQIILPKVFDDSKTGYLFKHWEIENEIYSGDRIANFTTMPDCDYDNNSAYINLWLKAIYTPKTYKIYLDVNGGHYPSGYVNVRYDSRDLYYIEATREGYRFMGWQYNNERIDNVLWNIDEDNITIVAMWEKLYTITLDANGGVISGDNKIEVVYGEYYGNYLKQPTRDKHKFLNWTYNGQTIDPSMRWNMKNNGTLVANWEELCRITLDAKGGNVYPNHIDLEKGQAIPALPIPSKTGYEFSGWYLNSIDFSPAEYGTIKEDITLTTKWWDEVVLTSEDTYLVDRDCTYVYLKGISSNLIKPMKITIASNVENVKFTTRGHIISCKSIIVENRNTPLTIELENYRVIGDNGEAAINASNCPNLNLISRGNVIMNGGASKSDNGHGALVCNNVNFYGKNFTFNGGTAGGKEVVDGMIKGYYSPGVGIFATGNLNIYCLNIEVHGGNYTMPLYRNDRVDTNKSSKIGSNGIMIKKLKSIYLSGQSTMKVLGGKGLSNNLGSYPGYVSDGGCGIMSDALIENEFAKINGNGILIVQGGDGGDNDDSNYQINTPTNGGSALCGVQVDSTIYLTEQKGAPGKIEIKQ